MIPYFDLFQLRSCLQLYNMSQGDMSLPVNGQCVSVIMGVGTMPSRALTHGMSDPHQSLRSEGEEKPTPKGDAIIGHLAVATRTYHG